LHSSINNLQIEAGSLSAAAEQQHQREQQDASTHQTHHVHNRTPSFNVVGSF
jgi:hypothetical protein